MKAFAPGGPGPVPRLLYRTSVGVLVVSTVLLISGAWSIGVTWDESYHVERWRNFAGHGWYVIDAQSFHGRPFHGVTDQYVYGPATMGFLHLWNMLFGVDSPGSMSTSEHGYLTRHLGIAFLSLVGLVGIAVLGRLVLRRWDWGVVAAACLAAIPMWTGHAMFNIKDVPVGTAYIWFTVGLCLLARRERGSVRLRAATTAAVAAGFFLMIGTRPGMWTSAFCSVVALLAATALREHQQGCAPRNGWWRYADLGAGLAIAYAGLAALYPHIFLHPAHTAYTAAIASSQFLDLKASRGFTPLHVALQVPTLLLACIVLGMISALLRMRRTFAQVDMMQVRLTLVGVQLLALPLVTMVKPSPLYSDLRQLLFAAPAAALFAAVGIATLVERARRGIDSVPTGAFSAFAALALVVPVVVQASLFPYVYTYYTGLIDAADYHPSTDYYRASGRALLADLPAQGRVVCSPLSTPEGSVLRLSHLDGARDCRTSAVSPIAPFAQQADGEQPRLRRDQFWLIAFTAGDPPTNCTVVHRITRQGLFGVKQLGVLDRCTKPFPLLTTSSADFEGAVNPAWGVFDEGWYLKGFSPELSGPRVFPSGGTLGFRLPESTRALPVKLETTSRVTAAKLRVMVDGREVRFTQLAPEPGISFLVPATGGTHHVQLLPRRPDDLYLVAVAIQLGRSAT